MTPVYLPFPCPKETEVRTPVKPKESMTNKEEKKQEKKEEKEEESQERQTSSRMMGKRIPLAIGM